MKSLIHLLPLLALCWPAAGPAQEITLFNGRDLAGWQGLPQYWSVKEGAITGRVTARNASKGNTFLVWQGGEVADFELSLKFRLEAENDSDSANSGVQFRASLVNSERFALKGYQAELDPGSHHPKAWPSMLNISGAMTDDPGPLLCPPGQRTVALDGEGTSLVRTRSRSALGTEASLGGSYRKKDWNECRIVAVGNHIQTFINGIQATDLIDEMNRHGKGLIGLQLHNPLQPKIIQFKDIRLTVLQPQASPPAVGGSSSAGPATVLSQPNQPRIEVIKDQGPNATEWALTPLDEAIPADICQNLTFLREDLLDEGATAAKASSDAYKLASQYCDKLLAALDQRDLARVNAGYAAAQADADRRISNQTLDARRNHQMSWPQYQREQSQRAALRDSEDDKVDVKKQRLKVEWTSRALQMRTYLDDLYRQLRGALR